MEPTGWSCCQCGYGPLLWSSFRICINSNCQHPACLNCKPEFIGESHQSTKGVPGSSPLSVGDGDLRTCDSSQFSSLLEPLLDPVGHYAKLRNLEEQVVLECRLQKYAHGSAIVNMESRVYKLETCVGDFQGLLKAIDLITTDGFCEDYITILVQNSTGRPSVAQAVELDIKILRELINGILEHVGHLFIRTEHSLTEDLEATLFWRNKILSHLRRFLFGDKDEISLSHSNDVLEPQPDAFPIPKDFQELGRVSPGKTSSFGNIDASIEIFLHGCKYFHSVLALAFSSYAGSHVSNFSQIIRPAGFESFLISPNLACRQLPLACLDAYLGSPAWIFGSPPSLHGKFQVAININAFADLWGPIWTVPADSPGYIRYLCTERGFLQRASSLEESPGTEIPCHWFAASAGFNGTMVPESPELFRPSSSNTSPKEPYSAPNFTPPIPENSRLLIGTPTDSTQKKPQSIRLASVTNRTSSQTSAPYGMTVHGSCCIDIRNLVDLNALQLAGVSQEKYTDDSYSFSIIGGKYVTFGASKTRKRIPATTYKDQLVGWLSKPNAKERIVPLLEIHAGLEVSICTGNARRITLWEALRLVSTLKRPLDASGPANSTDLDCTHSVGDTKCLIHCWNTRSSTSVDIGEWEQGDDYWRTIADAIVLFNHTGVDDQGFLRAYWPYRSVPHIYPVKLERKNIKSYWIRMVNDSPITATFATMTPRCLGYRARDVIAKAIQANECSSTRISGIFRDAIPVRTALQTRINISPSRLELASMVRPIWAKNAHSTDKKPENWEQNENTPGSAIPAECTQSLEGCHVLLEGKGVLQIRSNDNPHLAFFGEKIPSSLQLFRKKKKDEFQTKELMYEDHWGKQEMVSVLVI